MLELSVSVRLHITAATRQERQRWAALFARLLGSCNKAVTHGVWSGANGVEAEPDIVLTWLAAEYDLPKFERLLRYARLYHLVAKQEAILLEVSGTGFVLFRGDWECPATVERLRQAFSPGLALAEWFDKKAAEQSAVYRLEMGWDGGD